MHKGTSRLASMSLMIALMLVFVHTIDALEKIPYAYAQRNLEADVEETEDPEMMFAILTRLGQSLLRANEMEKIENKKRGLDLGLNRSYSGSQQAKHLLGIAAASGGPGRRRRSYEEPYRRKQLSY